MNGMRVLAVLVTILAFCTPAAAYPYKLYAKYSVKATQPPGETKIDRIEIDAFNPTPKDGDPPKGATFVPTAPTNGQFVGLYLSPKIDDMAKIELERLDAIYADVCAADAADCGKPIAHTELNRDDLLAGKEKIILFPGMLTTGGAVNQVYVHVRLHFSSDYMCEQERRLRREKGRKVTIGIPSSAKFTVPAPKTPGAPPTKPEDQLAIEVDATNASVLLPHDGKLDLLSYTTLFDYGLTTPKGAVIVYSYCKSTYDDIVWTQVASHQSKAQRPLTKDDAHLWHKAALADLILPSLRSLGAYGNIHQEKYRSDGLENTYGEFKHYGSLVRNLPGVTFVEVGHGEMSKTVDKSSDIVMDVGPDFCSYLDNCNYVIGSKLSAEVRYTSLDGKETTVTAPLSPLGGGRWLIADDISKHIRDKARLVVYYSLDNASRVTLLESTENVAIENLGVVTTFPAATEVIAVVNGTASQPNNTSAKSTIPLSWALNLSAKSTNAAAVTLPWVIGFNPRGAPRLSDYVAFFPHVSAIIPLSDSNGKTPEPRITLGVGLALAKAFTFSLAWPLKGDTDTYLLMGISATDLVDTFKALK